MGKKYTIGQAGNQKDSPDLVGFQIEDMGNGTYNLLDSNGNQKATKSVLPFTFAFSNYDNIDSWTVTVNSKSASSMSGTWWNSDTSTAETDSWTASGGQEDEDEARSASAGS